MSATELEIRKAAREIYEMLREPGQKTWAELCADPACATLVALIINTVRAASQAEHKAQK